jgi:hypothetical protein
VNRFNFSLIFIAGALLMLLLIKGFGKGAGPLAPAPAPAEAESRLKAVAPTYEPERSSQPPAPAPDTTQIPETSAETFLAEYPGGKELIERLRADGFDPRLVQAPPPLEEVWDQAMDALLLDRAEIEQKAGMLSAWSEDRSLEQIAEKLNFRINGKDIDRETLDSFAEPFNAAVEAAAIRQYEEIDRACQAALQAGEFYASPYYEAQGPVGLAADSHVFHSGKYVIDGWVFTVKLRAEEHPFALQAAERCRAERDARFYAVQAFIDNIP